MTSDLEERFQAIKLDVLSQAAFEDEQGIWEPLWQINSSLPDLPPVERVKLAERVLTDLYDAGLIFFLRGGPWLAEGEEPDPGPLDRQEVLKEISSDSWRTVPLQRGSTWFSATPAGEALVRSTWETHRAG